MSVDYATSDGTATAGADYTALGLTTLTFAPGEISKTVTVTLLDDTLDEPDETFNLDLTNAAQRHDPDHAGRGHHHRRRPGPVDPGQQPVGR